MYKCDTTQRNIIIAQGVLCTILILIIALRESPRHEVRLAVDLDLPPVTSETLQDRFSHPIRLNDVNPMVTALQNKDDYDSTLRWNDINSRLNTVVRSDDYCTRRKALTRAAGLFAGDDAAEVKSLEYTAETMYVKMASDSGALVFVPSKIILCRGDSIEWINNSGENQKVAFDKDPCVGQEPSPNLRNKGDSFVMKFTIPGEYSFYSIPHRSVGMKGVLIVE
mmetsp:Transcript_9613/g.23573  ORF Transcript_9613/g.23573 Transcript_9613/m.23573 type:complete len:223 (+) Transcript_9613:113-781(+)